MVTVTATITVAVFCCFVPCFHAQSREHEGEDGVDVCGKGKARKSMIHDTIVPPSNSEHLLVNEHTDDDYDKGENGFDPRFPWFEVNSLVPTKSWSSVLGEACTQHRDSPCADKEAAIYLSTHYNEPVKLTNSPITLWSAIAKWANESYLTGAMNAFGKTGRPPVVMQPAGRNVFCYQSKGGEPINQYLTSTYEQMHIVSGVPVEDFFDMEAKNHMYYSNTFVFDRGAAGGNELEILEGDVDNLELFNVGNKDENPHVTFWIGNQGTTSNTHYDDQFNFFAQVTGKKRFTVFSPSQWREMWLHPEEHPRLRQSQRIYIEPGSELAPNADPRDGRCVTDVPGRLLLGSIQCAAADLPRVPAIVADLDAGDLLYLPPYWFHRPQGMSSPSISVSSWSSVPHNDDVKLAFRKLPVMLSNRDGSFSGRLDPKTTMTAVYLRMIVEEVLVGEGGGGVNSRAFIRDIVSSRYKSGEPSMAERERVFSCSSAWDR